MKKVLIITYHFPPEGGAPVQRITKFVKYLPESGYQPYVLTARHRIRTVDPSLLRDVPDQIPVTDSDPKIIKHYGSAFSKTELAELLNENEINTIFLCGLSATGCVLATYFGAHEHKLQVFLVEDAIISWNAEHTNHIEEIFNTVELGTLKFMVDYIVE